MDQGCKLAPGVLIADAFLSMPYLDADSDGRNFVELHLNPANSLWDMFFVNTYVEHPWLPKFNLNLLKDKYSSLEWNCEGIKTAVSVQGTINNSTDRDTGWTAEMALPWKSLK